MDNQIDEKLLCKGCGRAPKEQDKRFCADCQDRYIEDMKKLPDLKGELYRVNRIQGRDRFAERLAEGFEILNKGE
jgi:predicted Fe-S protein YdhL (DUF1289 family)